MLCCLNPCCNGIEIEFKYYIDMENVILSQSLL